MQKAGFQSDSRFCNDNRKKSNHILLQENMIYQNGLKIFVLSGDQWDAATVLGHRVEGGLNWYRVRYTSSKVEETSVLENRIFPLGRHLGSIMSTNLVDIRSDASSSLPRTPERKRKRSKSDADSSVQNFRALTPSNVRYAEMFCTMQHNLQKLQSKVDAMLSGPVQKQAQDLTLPFNWDDFDKISNISEDFADLPSKAGSTSGEGSGSNKSTPDEKHKVAEKKNGFKNV